MRNLLAGVLFILIFLSGIAYILKPSLASDGKIRLTWLTPYTPARSTQVSEFNKLDSNIILKSDHAFRWDDLSKVIIQCSTGVGPDLFDSDGNAQIQSYIESGVAADVTEEARAEGFSQESMWPGMDEALFVNGKQYAYPANVGTAVLLYNKNVFDRFGVPYPKNGMTWDECIEIAKKITVTGKNREDYVYGLFNINWSDFLASMRGNFFSKDGTLILLNSDAMKKSFQLHWDLRFKHGVSPTDLVAKTLASQGGEMSNASYFNLFAEGHYGMYFIGNWSLLYFENIYDVQKRKLEKWMANPQRDPQTKPVLLRLGSTIVPHFEGMSPGGKLQTRAVVVNSRSPNRKSAIKLLKFLSGPIYGSLIVKAKDQLPPNPAYANFLNDGSYSDLGEEEMFNHTVESMKYCYLSNRSPFLLVSEISRITVQQLNQLEANPKMNIEDILNQAQSDAEEMMQRTIDRNPELKKKYESLTGTTNVHEAHERARKIHGQ